MSGNEAWLLDQDISTLDADKLRTFAYDLRQLVVSKSTELGILRQGLVKANHERSQLLSHEAKGAKSNEKEVVLEHALWIFAEQDYPSPTSTVLVFDSQNSILDTGKVMKLTTEHAVISKLPSRWSGTIYVFEETITQSNQYSGPRVRITTKRKNPPGLFHHSTIHLAKLPMNIKIQIMFGQINWIFILRNTGSRKSTWSSD